MATVNIALVVGALCMGTALSLQCYQCLTPGTTSNCPIKTNCEAKEYFCETLLSTNSTGHESVYKSCAVNCKEGPVFSSSIGSLDISCCRTDLCNISGAPGGTCSSALLSLGLAFISFFLRNVSLL